MAADRMWVRNTHNYPLQVWSTNHK